MDHVDYEDENSPEDIAYKIFSKPPKGRCMIQLHLEEDTARLAQETDVDEFIFNILSIITFKGVEILFGHKNILALTDENVRLLQEYVNSYGYEITKEYREIEGKMSLLIGFNKIY
jgi:hypothetical protein